MNEHAPIPRPLCNEDRRLLTERRETSRDIAARHSRILTAIAIGYTLVMVFAALMWWVQS